MIKNFKEILQNFNKKINDLIVAANACMKTKLFILCCTALCLCQGLVFADLDLVEPNTQVFLSEYYHSPKRSLQGYSKLLYTVERDTGTSLLGYWKAEKVLIISLR